MTTDVEAKKPGAMMARCGLWIAGLALGLVFLVTIAGGTMSPGLIAAGVAGLVIAGIGYAIRVVAALESR